MSAVAADSRDFEDNVVRADLSFWGFHKGKQCASDGYSPSNTLAQIMSGRTDNPGHKILCMDMPGRAWEINSEVMRLPRDYVAVLIARYCLPVEPTTGRPYDIEFLANLLGISVPLYRKRLYYAKAAYRVRVFGL
jgi:hypothetical protein